MSKLSNALTMLNVLSARSVVPLNELAELLEINVRSVQRLKEDLEMAGYNIDTVMGPGGGYQLRTNAQLQPVAFDMSERKKLKQALTLLIHQSQNTYDPDLIKVISKLSSQLNYQNTENSMAFQSVKLNVNPVLYSQNIEKLEHAIANQLKVKIEYQKNHKTINSYIFEPYELVVVNQFWYLFGYDQKGRYISLKVNRILSIDVTEKTYAKDLGRTKPSNLSEYGYRIDPVEAEFIVTNLDYLSEYIWGKNQQIEWLDDHVFKLRVEFPNDNALKDFALRGGAQIRVIRPATLIDFLRQSYENALKQYNL